MPVSRSRTDARGALLQAARCAALLLGICASPAGRAAESGQRPQRIASLNVCTDQLVLLLADPKTVVALSSLARDCSSAVMCAQGAKFHALRGGAEELLALRPDVVVGGTFTRLPVLVAARSVGARVETFAPADSLADIPQQIRRMGEILGVPERARSLAEDVERRLVALSIPVAPSSPVAAIYVANGYMTGSHSLPGDALAHAGLRNLAQERGLGTGARVPVEVLLQARPDFLIVDSARRGMSLAEAMLDSPALGAAFPAGRRVEIPSVLWMCGLPQTLDAVAVLRQAREAVRKAP